MKPDSSARNMAIIGSALVALTAISGCSMSTPVPAPPDNQSSPSKSFDAIPGKGSEYPRVESPIDTKKLEEDPCQLLNSTQRQQLEIPSKGRAKKGTDGPECTWPTGDGARGVTIVAIFTKVNGQRNGLSSIYDARKNYQDFQPISNIEGFPAVVANSTAKTRGYGACSVELGFSDTQSLHVGTYTGVDNPNFDSPCTVAQVVAKAFATNARNFAGE